MKFWNTNICLTSRKITLFIVVVLLSTLVFANVWTTPLEKIIEEVETQEEMWIPTAEDIAYQDSMYKIIQSTQNDINEIKQDIVYILERLEYEDDSWDSIRYVKGGKIDKRRN
jgi:hypothetical protein